MKPTFLILVVITFVFSCSTDGGDPSSGTFTDSRDGKTYKFVKIGVQTWMAENLNYPASGSKCYGEDGNVVVDYDADDNPIYKILSGTEIQANCKKYGRLYDWVAAMALPSSCNSASCSSQIGAKHRGICPDGWHIPSEVEWKILMDFAGGEDIAGKKLKAVSGWEWDSYNGKSGNGVDTYGFSALPGGIYVSGGNFYSVGRSGDWWCSSEYDNDFAYILRMGHYYENSVWTYDNKSFLFSVRCIKDKK